MSNAFHQPNRIDRFFAPATTRAAYRRAELANRRRPYPIEVSDGDDVVAHYPASMTPDEVIADVLKSYHEDHAGLDLVIRKNGYVVAVVVEGRNGQPELTRFDHEWRGGRPSR